MPKDNLSSSLKCYLKSCENVFEFDGNIVICKVCTKSFGTQNSAPKRFQIEQHSKTDLHVKNVKLNQPKQQVIKFNDTNEESNKYFYDLTKMLISCDIPIHKLNNVNFKSFLEKYTKFTCPHETTLRKNYVKKVYEDKINEIRSELKNEKIFISIDETTDSRKRCIGNVIFGALKQRSSKCYLLSCEILEKTNHSTISQLFHKSLSLLWPDGVQYEDVLLFLTDAAPYMCLAAEGLKLTFPKMIHLTCLAHGLHRVAEKIRILYPQVNKLISNVKKIFTKAPLRINYFAEKAQGTPLPPEPILTK